MKKNEILSFRAKMEQVDVVLKKVTEGHTLPVLLMCECWKS